MRIITIIFLLINFQYINAQKENSITALDDHHHGLRIAGLIGHTLIKSEGVDKHIFIPSWGLDIEYWISKKWGIGLHNDLEIESFIVKTSQGEDINRINPLVISLDALLKTHNGFVFSAGPGFEFSKHDSFLLWRLGIEYEYHFNKHFDVFPSLFCDQRIDGFRTYSFAFGFGYHI